MASRHLVVVVERELWVVTRTVYYYARVHSLRFDEVHVLTTRRGFENVMHQLQGSPDHPGKFERLCAHLGVPRSATKFAASDIHTLRPQGGRPIADFRDADDLVWLADQALHVESGVPVLPERVSSWICVPAGARLSQAMRPHADTVAVSLCQKIC